jgi:GT2 family glycosyltransferase
MSASVSRTHSEQPGRPTVGVVTVTHNAERFIDEYLGALYRQTHRPDRIILADSGSSDRELLKAKVAQYDLPIEIVYAGKNVGFCAGSNVGWRIVKDLSYCMFLNPDAFLAPDFIERAIAYMESEPKVGAVTPSLVRYDIQSRRPLDAIDTTAVIRNWWGNFVERDCGLPVKELEKYKAPNDIPWFCAAVAFARREALEDVVEHGNQIFDENFFMYKDDTDLSWRVRRAGWRIVHHPGLLGYHCRGWKKRSAFSRELRLMSARNEVATCIKNRSPFVLLSLVKYAAVGLFNI